MSPVQSLREFISARLTAAAEEIFTQFEQTIFDYQQEADRQRRLLDISWKPQIYLHRIELPQHYVLKEEKVLKDQQDCNRERSSRLDQKKPDLPQHYVWKEEEVLTDQQDCNQERSSRLDQEEPEQPQEELEGLQIKEEQQELQSSHDELEEPEAPQILMEQEHLGISHGEDQLVLKLETETFIVTPADAGRDPKEPDTNKDQLLSQNCPEAENQNHEGNRNEDSESSGEQLIENQRHPQTRDHRDTVDHPKLKKPFSYQTCGKGFGQKSHLLCHMRTHTEDPLPQSPMARISFQSLPASHLMLMSTPSHIPTQASHSHTSNPAQDFTPQDNSPATPTSVSTIPDITLRTLTSDREETFYKNSFVNGEHHPDVYAASVFMGLVPFQIYNSWVKKCNWAGTNRKIALPVNVKERVHSLVSQRFPNLTVSQWHRVRSRINERLRCPRKVDRETPRLGFFHT